MLKNKSFFSLFSFSFICLIFIGGNTPFVSAITSAGCVSTGGACKPGATATCDPNTEVFQGSCVDSGYPSGICCMPKPAAVSPAPAAPASGGNLQYTLLESIPLYASLNGSDLPGYIQAIYRIALILVTLSAVLMVSIGGFMYLTSAGNTSSMGTAKGIIFDSLIGLVIALSAWLVLNVINPDLTNISITRLPGVTSGAGSSAAPAIATPVTAPDGLYTHSEAAAALSAAGISVTSSGGCSDPNNPRCTSLERIPKSTVANLILLKNNSSCSFNVTGGTETGHASHGATYPIVDITENSCIANYLKTSRTNNVLGSKDSIVKICASRAQQNVAYGCGSHIEAKPHFHLVFKP